MNVIAIVTFRAENVAVIIVTLFESISSQSPSLPQLVKGGGFKVFNPGSLTTGKRLSFKCRRDVFHASNGCALATT